MSAARYVIAEKNYSQTALGHKTGPPVHPSLRIARTLHDP